MNRKIRFILVFVLLLFLAACEEKISEPTAYIPDNADHVLMFGRSHYTDGYNFAIGYSNGYIRSSSVRLEWNNPTSGVDTNYLATKLYRDGNLIKTFRSRSIHEFLDEGLQQDRYYTYTVAQLVNTGMNVYDTLTVKTPSIAAPMMEISVPADNVVKVFWKDMSDIYGDFVVTRQDIPINPFISYLNGIYSFVDDTVLNSSSYTYRIYKNGNFDVTNTGLQNVNVSSNHNSPLLNSVSRYENGIRLMWFDRSSAEDQIKIYRKQFGDPDSGFQVVGSILLPNQTEYLDTSSLITGQRYTYAVSAVNRYVSPPVETDKSNYVNITFTDSVETFIDFEDNSLNQFLNTGQALWTVEADGNSKGMCARSGYLSNIDYGVSALKYLHNLPMGATVTVEFDYKVISTDSTNRLYFYNSSNIPAVSWFSDNSWHSYSYTFVNNHSNGYFKWVFEKGYFAPGGTNYGWVDNIRISYIDSFGKKVYVDMGGQK